MATTIYPMPKTTSNGNACPGAVKPEASDGFHESIVLDEVARRGYWDVI
jgi:hypothetical protein